MRAVASGKVGAHTFTGPKTDQKEIEFAIRPEDVSIDAKGIPATVRVIEPLGAHNLVTCDVQDSLFRAVIDSDSTVKAGETIHIQPTQDRVRWFDLESTNAL